MDKPAVNQTDSVITNTTPSSADSNKSSKLLVLAFVIFAVLALVGGGLYFYLSKNKDKETAKVVSGNLPGISIESKIPGVSVEITDKSVFEKYFKEWKLDSPFGIDLRLSNDDSGDNKVKVKNVLVDLVDTSQPNGKIYDKKEYEVVEVGSYSALENEGDLAVQIYFNNDFYFASNPDKRDFALSNAVFVVLYKIFNSSSAESPDTVKQEIKNMSDELRKTTPLKVI